MQLAEDGSHASDPSRHGFLSPGKAFALLFGVILLLGAGVFFLRPDAPAAPTPTSDPPAPTFELTNAEAITRFEQLDALRQQAYQSGDPSLIDQVFVPGSDIARNVEEELRQLRTDGITVESSFETISLNVESNGTDEIELNQVVVIRPKFVSRNGKDVTSQPDPVRQIISWVLRETNGQWLIADAVITESKVRDQ